MSMLMSLGGKYISGPIMKIPLNHTKTAKIFICSWINMKQKNVYKWIIQIWLIQKCSKHRLRTESHRAHSIMHKWQNCTQRSKSYLTKVIHLQRNCCILLYDWPNLREVAPNHSYMTNSYIRRQIVLTKLLNVRIMNGNLRYHDIKEENQCSRS